MDRDFNQPLKQGVGINRGLWKDDIPNIYGGSLSYVVAFEDHHGEEISETAVELGEVQECKMTRIDRDCVRYLFLVDRLGESWKAGLVLEETGNGWRRIGIFKMERAPPDSTGK